MKWARRKPEISSSKPSLITRVLSPVSWFSKFKQKGGSSPEAVPSRKEQRNKLDFPTPSPSSMAGGLKQGRFYGEVDDDDDDDDVAYWRLSFGEEKVEARRSTGGMVGNHVWCDHGDDEFLALGSGSRSEEYRNFNEMVLDVKKMREKKDKQKVSLQKVSLQENGVYRRGNVSDHGSRKSSYGVVMGRGEGYSRSRPKDIFAVEPKNVVKITQDYPKSPIYQPERCSPNSGPISGFDRVSISEWQSLEEKRVKEIKVKAESQKKITSRKAKQNNSKVKAYSPRTECKIRALEEMKRAKIKLKKMKEHKEGPEVVGSRAVFDSFAVVKSSFNPQHDFKDSMVEMIREKGIRRPQELEELLACYLTLNRDEYHDLIIKVFRQVWLEINFV